MGPAPVNPPPPAAGLPPAVAIVAAAVQPQLTCAADQNRRQTVAAPRDVLLGLPLGSIVAGLPVRLRAELTWYVEQSLALTVGGAEAGAFTLHLRRGILEVVPGAASDAAATLAFADKAALVDYLAGASTPTALRWATTFQ